MNLDYDGQASFEGGQDSSLPPSRLPENRFVAAINTTTAKGVLGPRFPFNRKTLKFPEGGYSYKFNKVVNFKKIFHAGKFQALAPYVIGKKHYLVAVISGIIFLIDQERFTVKVLTLNSATQLNESSPRINWSPAGAFLVLFDYPNRPVIIGGHVAHRSSREEYEIPVSVLGTYNQSRMFFANNGNEFSAGDAVGNDLAPDAPVTIQEIAIPGVPYFGDVYQAPSEYNSRITAMATLQAVDSSTGIGSLITATPKEIFAFNTLDTRDKWLAGQFGKSISDNAGIIGPRAFVNVNSDLYFVSSDGQLRSLSVAREQQNKWARVPMSVEVNNWVSYFSDELKPYTTLCYFRNRIFWTVRPFRRFASRLDGKRILDVAHSGFVVLELDNISRTGQDSPPAWAGLWTGVKPMDMCVNNERMFVMSKDSGGNFLYEVNPEPGFGGFDTAEGQRRQIKSCVYTREFFFKDFFSLKDLKNVELGVSNLRGKVNIKVEWKPSHSSKYLFWTEFQHNVPVEYRDIEDGLIPEKAPLAFREIKAGLPDTQEGHPVTEELFDSVKRVQLRITLQADSWQLNEFRIGAVIQKESQTEFTPANLPEIAEDADPHSDWTYEEFGL